MNSLVLFIAIILYLAVLFLIAFFAEKKSKSKWVNNPYVYSLSLAVYCTAWTYYGSIGVAAETGVSFLAIYLGPVIAAPLWILILKKIIRISKQHKISSIADFISLRYGNNRFLGALITVICVLGIVPYISLQLKAVSESFEIMTHGEVIENQAVLSDYTIYIAVLIAVFATFFGTQKTDASEKHKGIVASVAFESIIKLVFFLGVGIYVTFYLFNGTEDVYNQISSHENFKSLTTLDNVESGFNWFFMILLSFFAIFLLPRQFQVSVVENDREKHLKKAIWLFPLYLLLFNIFVIFIAWAGIVKFGSTSNSSYYALLLPLKEGNVFMALLVFIGGFSAVISMVVVSTLALSTMVSNNLIIPYGFLSKFIKGEQGKNTSYIKRIRRISIFLIIIAAYYFYYYFSVPLSLYSIGLVSFVIISQLAPSFFMGLFWNRGSSRGAIVGLIIGFCVTLYTLVLPMSIEAFTGSRDFIENGLFGVENLKPFALFGIDFLSPHAHAVFWSLLLNLLAFAVVSLSFKGNYRERNYAEMFIDPRNYSTLGDNALVWKGEAYVADIKNVLVKFLGVSRTERALSLFFRKYNLPPDTQMADARLISFSEKLLTGSIGGASSKILIANVVKEQEISLVEVLEILNESKEALANNKALKEKSDELSKLTAELKNSNNELLFQYKQKDEFLDTVAHELKTPLTTIKASTEILKDDIEEMEPEMQKTFLGNIEKEVDRLARLVNHILDIEKLENNRQKLNLTQSNIDNTISNVVNNLSHLAKEKNIEIRFETKNSATLFYDEDRIIQVLTNLLSNAIKFNEKKNGEIIISYTTNESWLEVAFEDDSKGIDEIDKNHIFDKFYQSENQNTLKPKGSGLGLAISKQIIQKHGGDIWLKQSDKNGSIFVFKLPFQ
ncbi:MAG: sensor histidine kinase [Flavobacteriales bacterium]